MYYNSENNSINEGEFGTPDKPYGTNSRLAATSMILGLISVGALFTFVFSSFSIPLGAIGLLLAFMSTRLGKGIPSKAKTGILASSIGLGMGLLLTVISFITVIKSGMLGNLLNTYSSMYQQMYGEEIDWSDYGINPDAESFKDYFGNSGIVR